MEKPDSSPTRKPDNAGGVTKVVEFTVDGNCISFEGYIQTGTNISGLALRSMLRIISVLVDHLQPLS
jgi:hypothetical protein